MTERGLHLVSNEERGEFEALLKSAALLRSPSVWKFLNYISSKYLNGEAAQIKEYTIAVDAFGRSPEFDPKSDSIVRVEAHRLRKKLKHFYETEGKDRSLELYLDPGQYVPKFRARTLNPANDGTGEQLAHVTPPLTPEFPRNIDLPQTEYEFVSAPPRAGIRPRVQHSVQVVAAAAVIGLIAIAFLWRSPAQAMDPALREIRLISGNEYGPVVDPMTDVWWPDRWVKGGETFETKLAGADVGSIPEWARRARVGDFDYTIPLNRQPYELRLYFAKLNDSPTPLTRRFNVFANGVQLMNALDPAAVNEMARPLSTRVFHDILPASDGHLHLSFRSAADKAFVSAIELTPGQPGRLNPIRIVARAARYSAPDGKSWAADRYVTGGTSVLRSRAVSGDWDPNLFLAERYGAFSYAIPVSRGKYELALYFAETWFSPLTFGGGGVGSRRFDVYANGVPLLEDFDIYKEANGPDKGIRKVFRNLAPDSDGYINISFFPRVNFACMNALELTDQR